MATAAPDRRRPAAAAFAAVLAIVIAGCGGGGATRAPADGAFAWLRPEVAPGGWQVGRIPSHAAAFAYPPGWRAIVTDPGTFSAALTDAHHHIRGYLNATPRSGGETLANWHRFRVAHNREEGDRRVVRESSASRLRFRSGVGSCVTDRYVTTSSARYREIACIVRGARATTVIVGAAPPRDWARLAPQLRRSIASFTT
jgi:hypothetical protein